MTTVQDYINLAEQQYKIKKYPFSVEWVLCCPMTNELMYTLRPNMVGICIIPFDDEITPLFFNTIDEFSLWLDM